METFDIEGESKKYTIPNRTFDEFHGITMACITLNEQKDIHDFILHIKDDVRDIVMVDGGSTDKTVQIARPLLNKLKIVPFEGHLGNQKNIAISLSQTDWTLFLDPDERLTDKAISMLQGYINQDTYDCYSFPRREFLSGVENTVPFPDYQDRLFRTYCRYVRPIHHELVGYKNKYIIPINEGIEIVHSKEIQRHKFRNEGHNHFERLYKNEMSYPGAQIKETYMHTFHELNKMVLNSGQLE